MSQRLISLSTTSSSSSSSSCTENPEASSSSSSTSSCAIIYRARHMIHRHLHPLHTFRCASEYEVLLPELVNPSKDQRPYDIFLRGKSDDNLSVRAEDHDGSKKAKADGISTWTTIEKCLEEFKDPKKFKNLQITSLSCKDVDDVDDKKTLSTRRSPVLLGHVSIIPQKDMSLDTFLESLKKVPFNIVQAIKAAAEGSDKDDNGDDVKRIRQKIMEGLESTMNADESPQPFQWVIASALIHWAILAGMAQDYLFKDDVLHALQLAQSFILSDDCHGAEAEQTFAKLSKRSMWIVRNAILAAYRDDVIPDESVEMAFLKRLKVLTAISQVAADAKTHLVLPSTHRMRATSVSKIAEDIPSPAIVQFLQANKLKHLLDIRSFDPVMLRNRMEQALQVPLGDVPAFMESCMNAMIGVELISGLRHFISLVPRVTVTAHGAIPIFAEAPVTTTKEVAAAAPKRGKTGKYAVESNEWEMEFERLYARRFPAVL